MKKFIISGVILLLIVGFTFFVVKLLKGHSYSKVVPVTYGTINLIVSAPGTIEPICKIDISSKIPGKIEKILVEEGDLTKEGEILIVLEHKELEAQLQEARFVLQNAQARLIEAESGAREQEISQAEAHVSQTKANWENAKLTLERMQELYKIGSIAKEKLDSAETQAEVAYAQYLTAKENLSLVIEGVKKETIDVIKTSVKQAQARLMIAQLSLENAFIKSPLKGKVIQKLVEQGEIISPGMILLSIADTSKAKVVVEIDETDIGKVKVGQIAYITSEGIPNTKLKGKVVKIAQEIRKKAIRSNDPTVIDAPNILETEIELEEKGMCLPLNLTIEAKILTPKEDILILPKETIYQVGNKHFVHVLKDKVVKKRKIITGVENVNYIEIIKGVREGEKVVVKK